MLPTCKRCKECHDDLTLSKALGVFQMALVSEVDRFNSEDQAEICWLYRKLAAFQFIVDTLEQHGIYKEE